MSSCCPPNSIPYVAPPSDYKDQGEFIQIGDVMNTYVTGPSDSKSALILVHDIFGLNAGRHHLLCDAFAENKWRVYMPDLFLGESNINVDGTIDRAKAATQTWAKAAPLLEEKLIPYIQAAGAEKIAVVGFCFGYYIAAHLNTTGKVVAAGGAHPSLYNREAKAAEIVERYQAPIICLTAGNDRVEEKPGGEEQNIVNSKSFGNKCVFKEFPDMTHGWVCRGDANNEQIAAAVKEAFETLQSFYQKFL
jgi:carboxymethylenebutenolidase